MSRHGNRLYVVTATVTTAFWAPYSASETTLRDEALSALSNETSEDGDGVGSFEALRVVELERIDQLPASWFSPRAGYPWGEAPEELRDTKVPEALAALAKEPQS